ncbi:MAG: AAA family ATPase [Pseudomonadota bacterium]
MHVICLMSLKGGAGKSTVVQSLAVCANQQGHKTLIVELDPQGTLKKWSDRREASEPPVIQTLPQSLDDVLADARANGTHFVFLDTPGHSASLAAAAAEKADMVLMPCKIQSTKDIDAAVLTLAEIRRLEKPAYVLLNQVPPNARALVRKRQVDIQAQYDITVLSRFLSRRVDYEYCDAKGLSAAEYRPNGAAAEETAHLFSLLQSMFIAEQKRRDAALAHLRSADVAEVPNIEVTFPLNERERTIAVAAAGGFNLARLPTAANSDLVDSSVGVHDIEWE